MRKNIIFSFILFLSVPVFASDSSWSIAAGYQGVGADKGITLQAATPRWISDNSGLFAEATIMETAGIPSGESGYVHANYLLWHAGWHWGKSIVSDLFWMWAIGAGMNIPKSSLEKSMTPTGTVRTGIEYAFYKSLRAYCAAGVELNLWNRATEFAGEPFYGRGTRVQFGLRPVF